MGAQGDASSWIRNAAVNTLADLARIGSDAFRLGKGVGCALFNDQASGYDKAWAVVDDVGRGLTLTGAGFGARVAFRAAKGVGKAVSKARVPKSAKVVKQSLKSVKDRLSFRGPPNSILRGSDVARRGGGKLAFVTDSQGRIIKEITPQRVKVRVSNRSPDGKVFETFRKAGTPSADDLKILNSL